MKANPEQSLNKTSSDDTATGSLVPRDETGGSAPRDVLVENPMMPENLVQPGWRCCSS